MAFTYGRRTDLSPEQVEGFGDADLTIGNLILRRGAPFERWRIAFSGQAQDLSDPNVLLQATKDRPEAWFEPAHLEMQVDFDAGSPPHYAAGTVPGGATGHFEQTGRVTGTIALGDERWQVDAWGVRDKSWGPRTWEAPSGSAAKAASPEADERGCFLNWFSMNFGPDLALGGACGRTADGTFQGKGWIQRDGRSLDLPEVTISTVFDPSSPLLHATLRLEAIDAEGRPIAVDGTVLSICPTKIPRRDGVTFVNEGLARFTTTGDDRVERIGFGIAEHWRAVPR